MGREGRGKNVASLDLKKSFVLPFCTVATFPLISQSPVEGGWYSFFLFFVTYVVRQKLRRFILFCFVQSGEWVMNCIEGSSILEKRRQNTQHNPSIEVYDYHCQQFATVFQKKKKNANSQLQYPGATVPESIIPLFY